MHEESIDEMQSDNISMKPNGTKSIEIYICDMSALVCNNTPLDGLQQRINHDKQPMPNQNLKALYRHTCTKGAAICNQSNKLK